MLRKPCWSAHWIAASTVSGVGWWRNAAIAGTSSKPCCSAHSITLAISSRGVLFFGCLRRGMATPLPLAGGAVKKWRIPDVGLNRSAVGSSINEKTVVEGSFCSSAECLGP